MQPLAAGPLRFLDRDFVHHYLHAAFFYCTDLQLARISMRNMGVCLRNAIIVLGLALTMTALTGCVVTARPAAFYVGPTVAVAPPAPIVETYGVAPGPGYVWMGGYWNWVGGRHVWVGGHWEAGRPGYRWEPHHWVHRPDGWHMAPGHWARR